MKKFIVQGLYATEVMLVGNLKSNNTFLFFHGFGASIDVIPDYEQWYKQADVSILAFNRPGIGNSDYSPNYTAKDVVATAKEILQRLSVNKVSVIGWSGGAVYALQFVHLYPQLCRQLILLSPMMPLLNLTISKVPFALRAVKWTSYYAPFILNKYFKKMSKKMETSFNETWRQSVAKMPEADKATLLQNDNNELMQKATAACWKHDGAAMLSDAKAIVRASDIELQRIQLPVTIWQGTEDAVCKPAPVGFLSKQLLNCTYKLFQNEGHLLLLNHWKQILQNQ